MDGIVLLHGVGIFPFPARIAMFSSSCVSGRFLDGADLKQETSEKIFESFFLPALQGRHSESPFDEAGECMRIGKSAEAADF